MTVAKTSQRKETPELSAPLQDANETESQTASRKRRERTVTRKNAAPLAESTPLNALTPVSPETGHTDIRPRKRLSKAFSRPLDKKIKKETLVRDRFTFPEVEYAQLARLKKRLSEQEVSVKKSELVRAGLMLLSTLDDDELRALLSKVPSVG